MRCARRGCVMRDDHADAAATAATAASNVSPGKLAALWGAVAAGFTSLPWAQLAAAAAFVWSLHLIVGWWLDRLGRRGAQRKGRR